VLVARDRGGLEDVANAIQFEGPDALVHALDLREPRSAEVIVDGTLARYVESMRCSTSRVPFRNSTCST
jgi:hypothetical protein